MPTIKDGYTGIALPYMPLLREHKSTYSISSLIGDPDGMRYRVDLVDEATKNVWHSGKGRNLEEAMKSCFDTVNWDSAPKHASDRVKEQELEIERLRAELDSARKRKGGRTKTDPNPAVAAPNDLVGDDEG